LFSFLIFGILATSSVKLKLNLNHPPGTVQRQTVQFLVSQQFVKPERRQLKFNTYMYNNAVRCCTGTANEWWLYTPS